MSASVQAALVEAAWLQELHAGAVPAAPPPAGTGRLPGSFGARWQAALVRERQPNR